KATGLTIVIVEQSLNVALAVADRAVFMEKGQVRFEGPAAELLERDDLVRAVFLGGEGGGTSSAGRSASRPSSSECSPGSPTRCSPPAWCWSSAPPRSSTSPTARSGRSAPPCWPSS